MKRPYLNRFDKNFHRMRGSLVTDDGIRPTPASLWWREGIRPMVASLSWRKGIRPMLCELAGVGRDSRQEGNPPDPDLNTPNPRIPDARDIGGHRKSTI